MLNLQSYWRPTGRNFGAPKNMGGSLFSSFGVFGLLRGLSQLGVFVFKTPPKLGCVRGLRSWRGKKMWMKAFCTKALCAHCCTDWKQERHSELAVNKLSESIQISQIDIFLLHNDFSSWKPLAINVNFQEVSATNKAHSSVFGIFRPP